MSRETCLYSGHTGQVASDLTPAIFGVVGIAVGGVSAAWIERARFKRERNLATTTESRAFRTEVLQKSQQALLAFEKVAFTVGLRGGATKVAPQAAHEAHALHAEAMIWTNQIGNADLRSACDEATNALDTFGAEGGTNERYQQDVAPRYREAQDAISAALRALYE